MPSLPERPNLDHLKKLAKALLRAAQDGDAGALRRFAALPAFADRAAAAPRAADLALHDAQSVIAREHGFPSWHALHEEVQARTLTFAAAVDEFVRCATGGAPGRADRLLALHPAIATASLHASLVLGDVRGAHTRLRAEPSLATVSGGPQDWPPLLYVCHTSLHRGQPARADGLVAIARQLLALGADPNAEYHWNWHPELPRTALWAAVCAVAHLPLAEVLLDAGANPTDGVTAHIAAGSGNLEALELLRRHGLAVDGIPGGVPPLAYILTWSREPAGARWLLAHGADANLPWGPDNETPLHVAARRWDAAMVDALLGHGADPHRRRADGAIPHAVAEMNGNREVAARLAAAGAAADLSPVDRFVATCARGDLSPARGMLEARPGLVSELRGDHQLLLHRFAETGNVRVLDAMLSCGFAPDARDKDQVTPLHRAAMAGFPDAARLLLDHGADVNALDGMFAATPLVWAVEGRGHAGPDADHVGVARVLIDAGSALEWEPPAGAPGPERTHEGLIELRRAAARA